MLDNIEQNICRQSAHSPNRLEVFVLHFTSDNKVCFDAVCCE